jgi:GNAT superfamily N-acetyltransferase
MKNIRVRRGEKRDIKTINEHIAEWLNLKINDMEERKRESEIRKAVEKKQLMVGIYKGKRIGFIHYVMHEDIIDGGSNSFITAFFVSSQHRNKGVGSALLKAAIDDALGRGARGVETSVENPDARRLYERHNFEQFMGNWTMGEVFLELNIQKYLKQKKSNECT